MADLGKLTIAELAALVCDALRRQGLNTTLSGGACAQIYSHSRYVTADLDFVVNYLRPDNDKVIRTVMSALGFRKSGRIYMHADTAFSVEFPPGPLGIGEEYRIRPVEMKLPTGTLSLLSATDSAKDRLVGFFYADDAQCLEQAAMICEMNDVNMGAIRSWARNERQPDKFARFVRRLGTRDGRKGPPYANSAGTHPPTDQ